jgi:hypothetical protein
MKADVMIKRLLMKKTPHIPQTSVSITTLDFKGMNQRGARHFNLRRNPKGKN